MTNSSEFPFISSDSYVVHALDRVRNGVPINGMSYSNILLNGPGLRPTFDSNMRIAIGREVVFFPGGDPETGRSLETIDNSAEIQTEVFGDLTEYRERTLGLSISDESLARVHPETKQARTEWDSHVQRLGMTGVEATMLHCREAGLPLAVVSYSRLVQNGGPTSTLVGALYHPTVIHPKPALRQLQRAMKEMIAEEQI